MNRSPDARSDAGTAPDARAVDLDAIGARSLDSLDGAERTALCERESELVDPCLELARRTTDDPTACTASQATCRAQEGDGGFSQDCSSGGAGPAGGCSITVDEYLACAKAYAASLSCALAGRIVSPPDCASLSACKYGRTRSATIC